MCMCVCAVCVSVCAGTMLRNEITRFQGIELVEIIFASESYVSFLLLFTLPFGVERGRVQWTNRQRAEGRLPLHFSTRR